ncbi:MAG: Glutamine-dependent synthetase [Planctomycetota bacterium]|jgi:NAD+ synthase (glutamine-hydrolysing)
MRAIRLAAANLNQTPLDWDGNLQRILQVLRQAQDQHVQLLCLPELCITGYGCEDLFLAPHVWQTAWQLLQQIVPATSNLTVTVGLPLFHSNGVFNTACLISDRAIIGFSAKQHLAGDGLHYEPRWFRPWPAGQVDLYRHESSAWPLGDLLFERDGIRIGLEICEDAWVANRPGGRLAERGADVLLNPSASHFAFGKHDVRRRFILEGSRAFSAAYVYANLSGNEAGRAIYDGDAMIACNGETIASANRLQFNDTGLTIADVDLLTARTRRASVHGLRFQPDSTAAQQSSPQIIHIPGCFAAPPAGTHTTTAVPAHSAPNTTPLSKFDEFTRTAALGLFDYMRKTRSCGFVISMSGGADSSACAVLVRCMVELAAADRGFETLRHELHWIPGADDAKSSHELMTCLLAGVYQSTRNSSETTRNAAAEVTRRLGGQFFEISVDSIVESCTLAVEGMLGRQLTWATDDTALQNIQARTRSPAIWLLANVRNALLLATSNRSEAAVGYATMDGDTSGGLAPLAGIDKTFLREWLRVMETHGAGGCGPYPALHSVNQQQPTAELRPAEYQQTDERDLMPYPILNRIEQLAIRDRRSPSEVLAELQQQSPPIEAELAKTWVTRFFTLWSRNQWKRERFAPSFHFDDHNLDPRSWCRFPILSGGFHEELKQLRNNQ